ncbi:MAG: glucose-6-phosphate isomerase [Methylobacterium sp.]|nr:glucose-6-phosphate isomerase [Methylobacterium sp.]MCA3602710.1 glucose-6-phosphate isomerase [Methylobacterium sp.]MCA3615632.1 glucose-6-phosphate isomerase [Methylobacterium sp.]MCA4910863.1 glucose-6-phosphate isomerase [Methylobacterium sp.]
MTRNSSALDTAWAALRAHHAGLASTRMMSLFEADKGRFEAFSASTDGLLMDYSKCKVTVETRRLLLALAEAADVQGFRDRMFAGEAINLTENRAVLHAAIRAPKGARFTLGGQEVMADVLAMREACFAFAREVRSGKIAGAGGAFTDVVNIGIGGSDLGPVMAAEALRPFHDGPRLHFVSNVDGAHLADVLKGLDPARTLILVASKTFTTIETMTNARSARTWLARALGEQAVSNHFAAVSTAREKVEAFGIPASRMFGFWDWVGGRYSVWSSIGLPLMIAIGPERFAEFLAGGHAMDRHFREAPAEQNLPMLLGLIGIWHRNLCGHPSRAVIPYAQRLSRFPAYLQQLDMESNGKRVTREGEPVSMPTGPIVWGEPGTNGQHAFFQLIHQGTDIIPVEFLLGAKGEDDPAHKARSSEVDSGSREDFAFEKALSAHHPLLVANCLAQSQALMRGRTLAEAGGNPHRVFPGDRPSITLVFERLTPFVLGQLIALYEHRVFVEAAIWNINAYDQWGVELGKELATKLEGPVLTGEGLETLDGSTAGLIRRIRGE